MNEAKSWRAATSPKYRDLQRDGRYLIHAMPGPDDTEFQVAGGARAVLDPQLRAMVVEAVPFQPRNVREDDLVFEFDIERASSTVWERSGQPGTRPIRTHWRERARSV